MKKYVFSYINFFNNVLTSEIIEFDEKVSMLEIAKQMLKLKDWDVYKDIDSMEELKQFAFDWDSMFEIIEV